MITVFMPLWVTRSARVPGDPIYIFFTGSDLDPNEYDLFSLGSEIITGVNLGNFSTGSDILDTGIDIGFTVQPQDYIGPDAGFVIGVSDQMYDDATDPNGI